MEQTVEEERRTVMIVATLLILLSRKVIEAPCKCLNVNCGRINYLRVSWKEKVSAEMRDIVERLLLVEELHEASVQNLPIYLHSIRTNIRRV